MKRKKNKELYILIGLIIFIVLDQLSKIFLAKDIIIFEGFIKFSNVQNTGGAFGIFNSNIIAIIIVNLFIIGMIIRFLILKKDYMSNLVYIGLILIITGGISNLIDRIFRGHVIDFIDINQLFSFPVFNLADVVIVTGWFILVVGILKDFKNFK